jgi:hypothetical protein
LSDVVFDLFITIERGKNSFGVICTRTALGHLLETAVQ